jgi:hypothetical protein
MSYPFTRVFIICFSVVSPYLLFQSKKGGSVQERKISIMRKGERGEGEEGREKETA